MARPSRLRLLDEREVPDRPEDLAAASPVVELPLPPVPRNQADALIAELRAQAEQAQIAAAEERQKTEHANATIEALRREALTRIDEVTKERDAAVKVLSDKGEERKQSRAVATAVSLGLVRQIMTEVAKAASWLPVLLSLLGGFWLFDRSLAAPSPQTLVALGLYGLVVVAPAALLTLKGCGNA